jgi:hypothetical protein
MGLFGNLFSSKSLTPYLSPARRVHHGFYYFNDKTITNSLSAVEAGKMIRW